MTVYTKRINDVLDYMRLEPSNCLTSKSITALENFLEGYMTLGSWGLRRESRSMVYEKKDADIGEFLFWIRGRANVKGKSGPEFAKFLLDECHGDEEKAYDKFFELLDEFRSAGHRALKVNKKVD